MIHKLLRGAVACAVAAVAAACAPVPYQQLGRYDRTVVSDTERTCVGAAGGAAGPVHALDLVYRAVNPETGNPVLVFTTRGDVTGTDVVLRAHTATAQRTVVLRDGNVVTNTFTDEAGTIDVAAVPNIDGADVLVPVPGGIADSFTGADWSASMEMHGRIVSICGNPPKPVYVH